MFDVSVVGCENYEYSRVKAAISEAIEKIGGLDRFIKVGTKVAIKANLVASGKPEEAITTHPAVLSAITELCIERGAEVVIGDSPGGIYNAAFVGKIYKNSGLAACEERGAALNMDFSEKGAYFEDAKVCKTFTYTAYLDDADVIINACKLKTHGMMGLSCAAKNIFGVIPGTMKPEYHFRYPDYGIFANMIVDLDEYFKPAISICDGVLAMEGNGPTAGEPRAVGCILASTSPHKLDVVAASIIGVDPLGIPTIAAAVERGLTPVTPEEISVYGDYKKFYVSDFKNIASRRSLLFKGNSDSVIKNIFGGVAKTVLSSRPRLHKKECVGCNLCGKICPAKAITIVKGKAVIDKSKCIRCFCCQEFCPKGAMKTHRTFIARMLEGGKRKSKSKQSKKG